MQYQTLSGNKKLSSSAILTVTSFLLIALIAGSTVLPVANALHPSETIARVEYANACAPDVSIDAYLCDATLSNLGQTLVNNALAPDSAIGTATGGTVVSTDPLIKFRDAVIDNVWIAGPGPTGGGQTTSTECVFRDNNSNNIFDSATDTVIFAGSGAGACTGTAAIMSDPKIKFLDSNANGMRDVTTERVFYDFNNNGVAEIGTIAFFTDIVIYGAVDVFAFQVKVSYDPSKFNVRLFNIGQIWTDQGGSGFPSIDNVAGTAAFGATLTNVANAVTNPGPISLVRVNWRVMNEGASNVHLVTDVEDPTFGVKIKDSQEAAELYDTEDGFVSTVGTISALPNPEFAFSPPNPVSPGASVSFDASGSVDVDTFDWNFGDGATGSGTPVSHSYTDVCDPSARPRPLDTGTGCYRVFLTGTNPTGSATSTKIIIVKAPELNPTTTTVSCSPATVAVNLETACTATVTDTSATPSTPTGSVSFASSGAGTFSAASCTLAGSGASASCSVNYTPTAFGTGTHTITSTYDGDTGHSGSSGTFDVTVTQANRAPVASDDTYSTSEDTALTVPAPGVLGNDNDPDGDTMTAVLVASPSSGTLNLNGDGSFTYTPAANFFGTATFTYRASDGSLSDEATVTITVNPVNDLPVANDDAYSAAQGRTLTVPAPGVLGNDVDVDGDTLTAALMSSTSNGILTLRADGSFDYTPNAGFSGTDTFIYRADDGTASPLTVATVTINVGANASPTAVNDSYATDEDTMLNVPTAAGVLANDSDLENDPLTAILVTGPSSGTLTLNPDGSFTYTPAANFNGQVSFTYQANDGFSNSNTATVTITVNAINDAPIAMDDSYSTDEDTALTVDAPGVLANDSDVDGDVLTAVLHTGPSHGTLALMSDGSFMYTPNLNFFGTDTFTYGAHDSVTFTEATVTITVVSVNDAPVAADDSYSTDRDTSLTVNAPGVLGNDADVDGDPLTAVEVSGPTSGTLTLNADGSFTYTPNAGFTGTDGFTYRATDGSLSDEATVTITVTAQLLPPVISGKTVVGIFVSNPDALFATEPVTFTVSANDPDGGVIVSSTWNFGDGTPTVTVSGTMTTHTYAKAGTYTVTVFVTDDDGQNSAPFDPSITVDPEPRLARGKLSWTHHNSGDNEFTAKVQNPSRFAVSVYVQITLVPRDPGLPMLFAYSNAKVLTADSSVQDLVVVVSGSLLSVTKYDLEAVVFYSLTSEPGALPDGAFPVPLGTPGLIGNVIVSPPGVRFTAPGYASNMVAKKTGAFAQLD